MGNSKPLNKTWKTSIFLTTFVLLTKCLCCVQAASYDTNRIADSNLPLVVADSATSVVEEHAASRAHLTHIVEEGTEETEHGECLDATSTAAIHEDKMIYELTTVNIKGDRSNRDTTLRRLIDNFDEKEVFVTFHYGKMVPFNSINLRQPTKWKTDDILLGLVNGNIVVDQSGSEKLICDLKVRKEPTLTPLLSKLPLFAKMDTLIAKLLKKPKEETIAIAEFSPEDLKIKDEIASIKARFKFKGQYMHLDPVDIDLGVIRQNWNLKYALANATGYDESNVETFMRLTGKFFVKTMDKSVNKMAWELTKNVDPACPELKMITPLPEEFPAFSFPETDEFDPVSEKLKFMFNLLALIPFRETLTHFRNRSHGIQSMRQKIGKHIPEPKEGRWANPATDVSMKRVYFSSVGSFFVKKAPGFKQGYIADVTDISRYKVRDSENNYVRYGAKTFFDEEGQILKIEDNDGTTYKPGDKHWEWAKLKSRTAAFTKAAFVHLADMHSCWGNRACCALRMYLPPNHPLRRAFTPHFYKTHHTCVRAKSSLFDKAGLLSRAMTLNYEGGLKLVFKDYIGGFSFKRFPDEIKEQGVQECPFHVGAQDGIDLHNILCQYVSDLVDETYDNQRALDRDEEMEKAHKYLVKMLKIPKELCDYTLDNIKTIWGEILFRVTGYHNAVGAVTAFSLDPALTNLRQQEKHIGHSDGSNLVASEEAASGVSFIGAITQVPCPTIGQCWKQVLVDPDCKSYARLRKSLDELQATIAVRNQVRFRNVDYCPGSCAISISS